MNSPEQLTTAQSLVSTRALQASSLSPEQLTAAARGTVARFHARTAGQQERGKRKAISVLCQFLRLRVMNPGSSYYSLKKKIVN